MDEATKIDLLKTEYIQLQTIIHSFDGRVLVIKAWSITFSMASIGAAYVVHSPIVLLLAAISSSTFWLLEGTWKVFQNSHFERSNAIERYFSGDERKILPLQIGESWNKSFKKGRIRRLLRILFWVHVMLPHVLVIVLASILYYLDNIDYLVI